MAGEAIIRPGVRVLQQLRTASPTIATPSLKACIVGPAFEIVEAHDSEGAINPDARYTRQRYLQEPHTIDQLYFPSPRGNIAEVNILEDEIKVYFKRGSLLDRKRTGEAFLKSHNMATKAYIQGTTAYAGPFVGLAGKTLTFAVDSQRDPLSENNPPTVWKTCTFAAVDGVNDLTFDQVVSQINSAAGGVVASKVAAIVPGQYYLRLSSLVYGSKSLVWIDFSECTAGVSAGFGFDDAADSYSTGAGFYIADDGDGDNYGSWVAWNRGSIDEDSGSGGGLDVDGVAITPASYYHRADVDFISEIYLEAGDEIYVDGGKVGDYIRTVESTRIQLGHINAELSTYDSESETYTTLVLDPYEGRQQYASNPWSPKYVYFRALDLDYPASEASTKYKVRGDVATTAAAPFTTTADNDLEMTTLEDPPGTWTATFAAGVLNLRITKLGEVYNKSFTLSETTGTGSSEAAARTDCAENVRDALNAMDLDFGMGTEGDEDIAFTLSSLKLVITGVSAHANDDTSLTVLATGDYDSFGWDAATTVTGSDEGWTGLAGQQLVFTVDDSPREYTVTFSTDSMLDLPAAFEAGCGAVLGSVVDVSGSNYAAIESLTQGLNSNVTFDTTSAAATTLGFVGTEVTMVEAAERPNPDVAIDDNGDVVLQANIIRNPVSGIPEVTGAVDIYLQYRGLRLDVSPSAETPALLDIEDTATLETVLGPLNTRNPLGLAAYYALINSPTRSISVLGVDEISALAPMGTLDSYGRCAEFLEAREVYSITPLCQDADVLQLWKTHVNACSDPDQKHERILLASLPNPIRYVSEVVATGTNCDASGSDNVLAIESNINQELVGEGIDPMQEIPYDDELYIELTIDQEVRRYNISNVAEGTNITLRIEFEEGENTDGFYSTTEVPAGSEEDLEWSVKIRGALLLLPGTTRPDLANIALTAAAEGESYADRRMVMLFADSVQISVDGATQDVLGYYAAACIAGMIGQQPPQQGFTNYPMTGLLGVKGTNDIFSESRLDVVAGGGRYILIQEVANGPVFCRHQLTTNASTIENRELSITKVLDYCAKLLRRGLRNFIGTYNITQQTLDQISTVLQGMLQYLQRTQVILGYTINNVIQDTSQRDQVIVDVTLMVPYPCNYLQLTLIV